MLPREGFGPAELLRWLEDTQDSNERAKRSHAKRRAALRASPHIPPCTVVVILGWCNRSSLVNKVAIDADALLWFEQESGSLSFQKASV